MNHVVEARVADASPIAGCALCGSAGGFVVWADVDWRVVRVEDDVFPAFYRLISIRHVREFSDLSIEARYRCMDLACAIERTMLAQLGPDKMNLATFGNMVSHLHWHLIARFKWDRSWPDPIWAASVREVDPSPVERLALPLAALDRSVAEALSAMVA